MEPTEQRFLQALRAGLEGNTIGWIDPLTPEEWSSLFRLAASQQLTPVIYAAVAGTQPAGAACFTAFRRNALQMVMLQTVKTDAFRSLLAFLYDSGVTPLVVKGLVCRGLYPEPDARLSTDEDLLIPPEQFDRCHQAMLDYGMVLLPPEQDLSGFEVSYGKPGTPLRIELHRCLFSPEGAVSELNRFFTDVHSRAIRVTVQDVPMLTMSHTDHLFYLICHAFKHFLVSGFGIRQVCDICLYANRYGPLIHWAQLLDNCRKIHADLFTAALLRIGEKHLTFDPEQACCPPSWRAIPVDETAMLEDLLDSGVFGSSSINRQHSSNITLGALSAEQSGKRSGLLAILFPPMDTLTGLDPRLKEKPWLLPAVWGRRLAKYGRELVSRRSGSSAGEALRIGRQRIRLMKQYGIIRR